MTLGGSWSIRKSMIDEFVRARPQTREEWFMKIPEMLRSSIDSRQIRLYLDRVLEIIAASSPETRS